MYAFLKYIYIIISISSSYVNTENGQVLQPVRFAVTVYSNGFAYIWEKYIRSSRNALVWNPW